MEPPKVLVGCPTSNHKAYCLQKYAEGVKELTYPHHNVLLVDNSEKEDYLGKIKKEKIPVVKDVYLERAKERITHSRNILRKKVLDEGYDYLLSLEQDVIPPKDVIEKLLAHGKKVITGVYFTKYTQEGNEVLKPLLWKAVAGKKNLAFVDDDTLAGNELITVKASGLGCMLIHRSVLEKIPFRLFEKRNTYDDMAFCSDLHEQKIALYADTSVKCKHLIKGMNWDNIKE